MIDNDDLLHRIDPHYLGPAGHTLPLRVRYQAAGVGFVVFTTVFVIARAVLHAPLGFRSLMVMALVTVYFTTRLTRYINADRPLRSIVRAAWNDLIAPRPPKQVNRCRFSCPGPLLMAADRRLPAAFP